MGPALSLFVPRRRSGRVATAVADEKLQRGPHRGASENVKYHLKSVQSDNIHASWGPESGFPMTITGPRCNFSSAITFPHLRGPVIVIGKPLPGPQEAWMMTVCTLFR